MRPVRLPPTLRWRGDAIAGHLDLLDQTLLPGRIRVLRIRTVDALVDAIRRLAVRGAPALGVAGAYGVVLAARRRLRDRDLARAETALGEETLRIEGARPTAVNLALGVRTGRRAWVRGLRGPLPPASAARAALRAAKRMHAEDSAACRAMGRLGARFLRTGGTYLTHCNTGALATAGIGTAFAVFVTAKRAGKRFTVLADETRPLLQGARLTALELAANGIHGHLIPDGAAGGLMARGLVDGVFVGADRVAANGDFANKVGTYPLAVLAREHRIPFYCVAPATTIDPETADGGRIPIEERDPDEVRAFGGRLVAPRGFPVVNPAFDVTPARLVTALVTDRGVVPRPDRARIARLLRRP
jgi:methylthioribose-1-phosphate isomerase